MPENKRAGANRPERGNERVEHSAVSVTRSRHESLETSNRMVCERLLPLMQEAAQSNDPRVPRLAIEVMVHVLAEHIGQATR